MDANWLLCHEPVGGAEIDYEIRINGMPDKRQPQTVTTSMPASVKGRICSSVALESVTKVTRGGSSGPHAFYQVI